MNISREYDRIIPKKCPVCGSQRDNLTYEPVGRDKTRTAIYVSCEKCLASIVFFITQNEMGIITMGVLTDVNAREAKNFFGATPVSDDDIIDMYEYLNDFSGATGDICNLK
ncbi:MAG: hypothetical protein KAT32_02250 [Candidatus Moranbacteria bacterium]|nr:hypothetical protein [Candidatus Moranbacteria bacterium]